MSKLFTFSEAKTKLAPFVDNGTCSATILASRINEAVQRLIVKRELENSPRLIQTVRFQVRSNEFALPRGVEKLVAVNLHGTPGHVFNGMYQFLSSGPGDLSCAPIQQCGSHVMDLGESPFQFPLPETDDGLRLVAFTTKAQESSKLKVWGYDTKGRDLYEELPINGFKGGVEGQIGGVPGTAEDIALSTSYFKELSRVTKIVTSASVILYAVDASTHKMWMISRYHAKDTLPMYRRYRVVNKGYNTGVDGDERNETCILARVKMGFVDLVEDDDLVPVDSLPAMKNMLIALKYENDGNIGQAAAYEGNAVRLLEDVNAHHDSAQGTPVIIDFERRLSNSVVNRWPYI